MANVRLVLLALAITLSAVQGHRLAINGTSGGAEYSTWDTALELPYVTAAWDMYRIVECEYPYFWIKFRTDYFAGARGAENDNTYNFTSRFIVQSSSGTPALAPFSSIRTIVTIIGPGLYAPGSSNVTDRIKARLNMTSLPPTEGDLELRTTTFLPPRNVSTCDFVKTPELLDAFNTSGNPSRCVLNDEYATAGEDSWVISDNVMNLLWNQTYYMAVYLNVNASGRFWLTVSNYEQSEDITTPYEAPLGEYYNYTLQEFFTDDTMRPGRCASTPPTYGGVASPPMYGGMASPPSYGGIYPPAYGGDLGDLGDGTDDGTGMDDDLDGSDDDMEP